MNEKQLAKMSYHEAMALPGTEIESVEAREGRWKAAIANEAITEFRDALLEGLKKYPAARSDVDLVLRRIWMYEVQARDARPGSRDEVAPRPTDAVRQETIPYEGSTDCCGGSEHTFEEAQACSLRFGQELVRNVRINSISEVLLDATRMTTTENVAALMRALQDVASEVFNHEFPDPERPENNVKRGPWNPHKP